MHYHLIYALLISGPLLLSSAVATASDHYRYFGVEHFSWDEYNNDHGHDLGNWVSEYGPRFHWGTTRGDDWQTRQGTFYRHKNNSTLGLVRYDGGLVKNPEYKLNHYTLYISRDRSRQWGYRVPLGDHVSISPTATLGLHWWGRNILPKKVDDPDSPGEKTYAGAAEIFVEPYVKLGLQAGIHFHQGYRMTFEAGQQRPLHTWEWHNDAGFLSPEPNWNDYAAIEFSRYGNEGFFARLDYQDKLYDTSELNSKGWFQPESHERTIGLTFGWRQ